MRKLFLVASLMMFCTVMSAQGLKGTWFAGGNVSFGKQEFNEKGLNEVKETTIMPLAGKFISPTVAVGGALGFSQIKPGDNKSTTYTIMPLARKYWNIAGNLYVFGQMALPVGITNAEISGADVDGFGVHFQVAPGFDLIVNKWLSIEASFVLVNAGFERLKPDGGDSATNWALNAKSIGTTSFGDLSVGIKILF